MNAWRRSGFTLIEMLAVMAIIAILAGLLLPTVAAVRRHAYKRRASAEVAQLEAALKSYYMDNRGWTGFPASRQTVASVVQFLQGSPGSGNSIPYMEFKSGNLKDGNFVDPWGNPYRFELRTNPGSDFRPWRGQVVYRDCVAWSMGPDGRNETDDDIKSWE